LQFKEIWGYLETHNSWNYLNTPGNIKVGDTIRFMIDPEFNATNEVLANTIFMVHGSTNQVVGVLKEAIPSKDRKSVIPKGLKELRERIWS